MNYEFADTEKWSDYRLEKREAYLRETNGNWLTQERKDVKAHEIGHILFELDKRYPEQDVLGALEEVVERGADTPSGAS